MAMMTEAAPKRIIDRERQWRRVDRGHYRSPKGRFDAVRDDEGSWMLLDANGEFEPEWFARWRDARSRVEAVEFAAPELEPIELVEDEIRDDFHASVRVRVVRGGETVGDVVAYGDGRVGMPQTKPGVFIGERVSVEYAEAFATALMVAAQHAASMTKGG